MAHAFYSSPGPLTALSSDQVGLVRELDLSPLDLCRTVQGLLAAPADAFGTGLSDQQLADRNTRSASTILRRVLEFDPVIRLGETRPPGKRVVGTCRHFAVLATAFVRATGVAARARCGFAAYFDPPRKVDHWITEVWSDQDRRWVRIDPEYLHRHTPSPARTDDLRDHEFLTAGEAWRRARSGSDDPDLYGVFGTDHRGLGEIRANAMRDLASVAAKIEVLPWDEWGPMAASYEGTSGDDFDRLVDLLADATADPRHPGLDEIYDQLAVPTSMVG